MANGDIYELNLYTQHSEQVGVIRRYYIVENTTGSGPTMAQIATRMDTAWPTPLKNCMNVAASYLGLTVARVHPGNRTRASVNVVSAGLGAVAGELLPRQVRGIITLRTDFAGPGFRGRIYVPFPGEGSNFTDGTPNAAYLALLGALGTVASALQGAIGVAGNQADLRPIVWHLPKGLANLPINRQAIPIVDFAQRNRWATQRRSGSYGRPNVISL